MIKSLSLVCRPALTLQPLQGRLTFYPFLPHHSLPLTISRHIQSHGSVRRQCTRGSAATASRRKKGVTKNYINGCFPVQNHHLFYSNPPSFVSRGLLLFVLRASSLEQNTLCRAILLCTAYALCSSAMGERSCVCLPAE